MMKRTKTVHIFADKPDVVLVFGYSRVSTKQQEDNGDLLVQHEDVRAAARRYGWQLGTLEEDIGSAHRKDAMASLPGLADLLRQAKAASGMIVVTDVSRLSRNVEEWRKHILPLGVPVYSLRDGRVFSGEELEAPIRAAEVEAKRIGCDTKNALAGKEPVVLDSSEMRRRGSVWNVEREMRILDDCIVGVQILRERGVNITAREFGEELIRRGRKPPRGSTFTRDTARERRRAALEQLTHEVEVDAEPFDPGTAVNEVIVDAPLGTPDFSTADDLKEADHAAYHDHVRQRLKGMSRWTPSIVFGPIDVQGGDHADRDLARNGRQEGMAHPGRVDALDAFKGRQRRSPGLHGPLVRFGRPRARPEPKERPPPARGEMRFGVDIRGSPFCRR